MADLMFYKRDYEAAVMHFQQFLDKNPDSYEALARLVDVTRRAGQLDLVPPYVEQAENACPRPDNEPGINYCKGLYEW